MTVITANELKKQGVSALEPLLEDGNEVVITVRGKNRFVVIDMEAYTHLRECELEAALQEARKDLESGSFVVESVADHVRRVADDV